MVPHLARLAAGLVTFLLVAACGESPTDPPGGQAPDEITSLPRQLHASEVHVIEASNRFAFELARQVSAPDSGFFVSPLSASMALGMTMNGAGGDTRDQMRDALGFGDLAQDEINDSYRGLIDLLLGLDPAVETAVGNSVWHRTGFEVRETFLDAVREHFDARTEALDFSDPGAAGRINGWVSEATRERIEEIVPDPVPSNVVLYLINAIYFEGDWTWRFDPEKTADAAFHRPDGSTRTVPLMERRFEELPYHRGPEVQVVDLPYGGRAFSMTVILPDPDVELEAWLSSLDAERWAGITDALDVRGGEVHLFLPRFEMEYERTLNDDLKALGMTDAFAPGRADFSEMTPGGGVWIDEVKQKAFVSVDEEGTEAAAATSVAVVESAPPTVRVDRPFLFVIRERLSGTILFLGKVVDPGGEADDSGPDRYDTPWWDMDSEELADNIRAADGRFLVGFKDPGERGGVDVEGNVLASDSSVVRGKEVVRSLGLVIEHEYTLTPTVLVQAPRDRWDELASIIDSLRASPFIDQVEPDLPGEFSTTSTHTPSSLLDDTPLSRLLVKWRRSGTLSQHRSNLGTGPGVDVLPAPGCGTANATGRFPDASTRAS